MSSYGAIGLEGTDVDPLLEAEASIRRSTSAADIPVSNRLSQPRHSLQRQPYLFTGGIALSPEGSQLSLNSGEDFHRQHNNAVRYRLYNRLDQGQGHLRMPDHVTPPEYFSILPFDELRDRSGKQSSLVTIFSLWNTIMGTSLLTMPWALQQAGLALGIIIYLAMCAVCLYTAYRVLQSADGIPNLQVDPSVAEFSDVCEYFFGKIGMSISVVSSVVVFLGGIIVYWVLMSNFLYFTGTVVYDALQPNSSTIPIMENKTFTCDIYCPDEVQYSSLYTPYVPQFSYGNASSESTFDKFWQLQNTVPFYLAIVAFPLFNFKSPTFFTKFNVLGTISVVYLLVFTGSKFVECGFNMDFVNPNSIHYVKLFNWKFPALTGTLTLSYFIHNAVRTILRNQRNPENNARDLSIAYCLAAGCYVYIAVAFFAGFPVQRSCISDNMLNNFGTGDILSSMARLFLLFQMLTVLPLLMYLTRTQIFYAICGDGYPGLFWVILMNLGIMSIAIFFAVFYPKVGSIIRYVGAICGMVYVFTLPTIVHLKKLQMRDELTNTKKMLHFLIIGFGVANMIAQFIM
ncbi:unnamed protein product [Auanema sp. JU1783]|nr:unnamed protein product [Auanema sp. JU1783]